MDFGGNFGPNTVDYGFWLNFGANTIDMDCGVILVQIL